MKTLFAIFLSLLSTMLSNAQEKEFDQIANTPKPAVSFPLDYKITRPRLEYPLWDEDWDKFYDLLTPVLLKTQASLSYTEKGVVTSVTPNSIIPHAQLDTNTIVKNKGSLIGTWRM